MKKFILAIWLAGAVMLPQAVQAQLGKIVGTAWTIGTIAVGKTTLTPAYAVQTWYSRNITTVGTAFGNMDVTQKVRRDLFGVYFYYQKVVQAQSWPFPNPNVPATTNVFPVNSMDKLNMFCVYAPKTTARVTQTATEAVWMDSVVKTGAWPDNGPWTVWLKTGGSPTDCSAPAPLPNFYWWSDATVGLGSGYQIVSLGGVNATLNFPFYLANEFTK